ncbi:MAG: polysaccharide biosynthesis C-terminal domain-containing protein [Candidatus Cloacimonetes bacterium]|nr:polysaccharide biosynthesis C-terminal domain-containing protein [Candidatus Cloacimonadota bacterium]
MKKYLYKALEYTAGNFFKKLILLFLLPIFTRLMAPQQYAVYENLMIFISFVSLIYFLGQQQAVFSYYYHKKTPEYHFSYITTVFLIISVIGFIFSILVVLFRTELSALILRTTDWSHLFVYIAVILFCDVISGMSLSILNIMERSRNYLILGIIKNALFLLLVIYGTITQLLSITTIFIFFMISSLLSLIAASFYMMRILTSFSTKIKRYFSSSLAKKLLGFGIIMIPGTIAMMILRLSDRYMLTYFSAGQLYDVGIYAIGYRIGAVIVFINSIVSLVYFPYAMKIKDNPLAKKSYKSVFYKYSLFAAIAGVLIILFEKEIFYVFIDSSYFKATKIVVYGVLSSYLLGLFNLINLNFYVKKKAGRIAGTVIFGALLNIGLNYILIPKYGVSGAGMASFVAYFSIVIINYNLARSVYEVLYKLYKPVLFIIFLVIIAYLNHQIPLELNFFFVKLLISVVGVLALGIFYWKNKERFMHSIFVVKD